MTRDDDDGGPTAPDTAVQDILATAERVGPTCRERMEDPAALALVLSRIRSGAEPEDAVLAVLHGMLADRRARELGNEFMAFFLNDLMAIGRRVRSGAVARLLETHDLVQSVVADAWPEIPEVEFRSRGQFVAYLAQRIRWKSGDVGRRHGSRRAVREELDAPLPEQRVHGPSPASELVLEEERQQLVVALFRLRERDRNLLSGWLQGETVTEAADRLGLSAEAASKARHRALQRARTLL